MSPFGDNTPKDLFTTAAEIRCYLAYDNIVDCGKGVQTNSINLKIVPADHYSTNNLLLFLVTGLSTRWPSQWLHFLNFLSPKWLCYKSSLTHPKCTKSHLQRSRFQKIFPGEKPPNLRFWGGSFAAGRGWGGRGRKRGKGKGVEGRGKVRGCGEARKVVCPGACAGSRPAWLRLRWGWRRRQDGR